MEDKKNMTPEEMDNQEEMTVTLTLDDGKMCIRDSLKEYPFRRIRVL